MKIVEVGKSLALNSAKKGATIISNDSFVQIVKPTKGLKSVGFIVTLLASNKEFYCDNVVTYGGKLFCTSFDDAKITMCDITTGAIDQSVDRVDVGPQFAIVTSSFVDKSSGEKVKKTNKSILTPNGAMLGIDAECGFYGNMQEPSTVKFKDADGNLSNTYFVDVFGKVHAGFGSSDTYVCTKLDGKQYIRDLAGREGIDNIPFSYDLKRFVDGKIKIEDLSPRAFEDKKFADAILCVVTKKYEEKKKNVDPFDSKYTKLKEQYKKACDKIKGLRQEALANLSNDPIEVQ